MHREPEVRRGIASDMVALNDMYNDYVASSPVTFDIEPIGLDSRMQWFERFASHGNHQLFVATRDRDFVGYASSGTFRSRAAYDSSVETSVYLVPDTTSRGIGSALYAALFDALASAGIHRALAGITLPNAASLALHRRFGFTEVGVFSEVGYKFERHWDVQWMQKALSGR